ncbi:MAG: VWA domain-containing protein [Rhodanobacteraceae bacterium]|nr:VWA domain-containing protein [Rhodanobacteraceae bacterium]
MKAARQAQQPTSPLAHSRLLVTINDLLAEYELSHHFRNEGEDAVELVYSFPVPLDAAFLGMQTQFAGATLTAQVLPARQASSDYADAVADGDGAVLLEQVEPGMLCVNLGNLPPGEQGEIVLRFAAPLAVADRSARFSLPLVHRPRYGRSRLDALLEPGCDFAVEHPLAASIRIHGLLAEAAVGCPTHPARFQRGGGATQVEVDAAMLDRDFVLTFDFGERPLTGLRVVADAERNLGILTLLLPTPAVASTQACDICLLMDCSGSMQGDAIVQSRAALGALAMALDEGDRIQVLRFGDECVPLLRRPMRATARVRDALQELTDTINADLGGTEMNHALEAALTALEGLDGPARNPVIVLVTDGAVHAQAIEPARARAARSGVRIFVVAVGSSAGSAALHPLAASTGATLERAVPAEPIAAAVLRQLRRARMPAPQPPRIDWGGAAQALPLPVTYPGDALVAVAVLPGPPRHAPAVQWEADGARIELDAGPRAELPAWRAWAGQQVYLAATRDEEREALALRYGLICAMTSAVLVQQRAPSARSAQLPRIVPVAHMARADRLAGVAMSLGPASLIHGLNRASMPAMYKGRPIRSSGLYDELTGLPPCADVDADATERTLSPERVAQLERAILPVLLRLVLVERVTSLDRQQVLDALAADLREDAALLWARLGCHGGDIHGLFQLLVELGERHAQLMPVLDEEQELHWSRLSHHLPLA